MRRSALPPAALALALLLATPPARAGIEGIELFWQPVLVEGMGAVVLVQVPYSVFGYTNREIGHVSSENRIWSASRGYRNMNLANLSGVSVTFDRGPAMDGWWGDTLGVVLDARDMIPEHLRGTEPDTLVAATLECIRATAVPHDGSPGNRVNYLRVTVRKPDRTRRFVWDLREPFTPRTDFRVGRRN